jgi:DNA-binding MarR family transcriptional regulator
MEKPELIKQVIQLQQAVGKALREYSPVSLMSLNLTMVQFKTLFLVASQDGITSRALAATSKVTPANITGIIDRLAEQGLVSRQENPEDRRKLTLRATEKGQSILANLRETKMSQLSTVLHQMSSEDLSALAQGLSALLAAIEKTS